MLINYCVSCHNRYWQLKRTLLSNLEIINDDECAIMILVNFNGEDSKLITELVTNKCMKYINNGKLVYYHRIYDDFKWNMAIAKSITHRLAKDENSILVNLDCDNYLQKNDPKIIRDFFLKDKNIILQMSASNRDTVELIEKFNVEIDEKEKHFNKMDDGDVGRLVISKSNYDKMGGYDEYFDYMGFQDTDFIIRCIKKGMSYKHVYPFKTKFKNFIPNKKSKTDKVYFRNKWNENFKRSKENIKNNILKANKSGYIEDIKYYKLQNNIIKNKINRLVILTTATCRPEMHNIVYSGENLKIFRNIKYDIEWVINVDKTEICKSSQKETSENLKHLLKNFTTHIYLSEEPSFIFAFSKVINEAKKYINKNTAIMVLEDDWIVNTELNLDINHIINSYHSPNTYISLVFNKFCCLPPCLIGYNMFKYYSKLFNLKNINIKQNPEQLIRRYVRKTFNRNNIKVNTYLIIDNKQDYDYLMKHNECLKKSTSLNEVYLKENKKFILELFNDSSAKSYNKIYAKYDLSIINPYEYLNLVNNIPETYHYIRFRGQHSYNNYQSTYFKDIGRLSEITPKIYQSLYGKQNVIFTSYYHKSKDPQRNRFIKKDNFDYIQKFYDSVIKNNLTCVIFHDGVSKEFIDKYSTNKISFVQFSHDDYKTTSGNDTRFLVYLDYIKDKSNIKHILISDISGVTFFDNPFKFMKKNKLLIAPDRSKTIKNKKRTLLHSWFKNYAINAYGSFDKFKPYQNNYSFQAGFFGGSFDMVNNILLKMKEEFDMADISKNCNYVVYNYVIHKYFSDTLDIAVSSYNGYDEQFESDKKYIVETRTAKKFAKLYWK